MGRVFNKSEILALFNCSIYTARRLRPLARRAFNTARPLLVFMRTRNPWVRLRRVTDGWYVLFMIHPAKPSIFLVAQQKVNR